MVSFLLVPLKVIGLGIVISYAIALMMKVIMFCIRFTKKANTKEGVQE